MEHASNGNELDRPMYFQPHPVKAMRLNSQNHWQIFNEGATTSTWWEHHDMIKPIMERTLSRQKLMTAA
jgi:hypothetical protein